MSLSPIVLFVYDRPKHTKRTIDALLNNALANESKLFIFSDGPKSEDAKMGTEEIRKYLRTIAGFKKIEIRESIDNKGLANSIIEGVTEIVNRYGKVIVLEDDLVTSPHFLTFMNEALDLYKDDDRVASVHGYTYPTRKQLPETFFVQHASSWGWATWKRAWTLFEPDGAKLLARLEQNGLINKLDLHGAYNFSGMLRRQISGTTDSWAIRWNASCLVNDILNLYPRSSLVQNIGQDGTGTHRGNSNRYKVSLSDHKIKVEKIKVGVNVAALTQFEGFFRSLRAPLHKIIISKIKQLLPVRTKVFILNIIPNISQSMRRMVGRMMGINIVFPDPKLPNYYMFISKFGPSSTIIDVGCGFDADFSMYMIRRYGLGSIGIDPTLKHEQSLRLLSERTEGKFVHKLWAISNTDGKITFNESKDSVSGSILDQHKNIQEGAYAKYDVESVSLRNLPDRLGLAKIVYIKLDIEGAEYDLIDTLNKEDLDKYDQIFIEFHHHALPQYSPKDTLARACKIRSFGFKSFSFNDHDFLFYR